MATVGENVQSTVVPIPTSVPVRVAHELLLAGHRYLDVRYSLSLVFFFGVLSFRGFFFSEFFFMFVLVCRTPEEFSAGHAVGAVNVPYMFRLGSGLSKKIQ